jgi:hypothetical protein
MPTYGTVILPDGREIACPRWAPSPDVIAEREKAMLGAFFLVRIAGNDGLGELWRCRRCRGRHVYLTASCVERPFSGLDQVLYVIWQQAGDLAAVRQLSPHQAELRDVGTAIARQVVDALPDLATAHPDWAQRRARQNVLAAYDLEVSGVVLGRAEQIPRTLAQRLLDKVNTLRQSDGKLVVDGLETR